jgi:hypothetical protein
LLAGDVEVRDEHLDELATASGEALNRLLEDVE